MYVILCLGKTCKLYEAHDLYSQEDKSGKTVLPSQVQADVLDLLCNIWWQRSGGVGSRHDL